MFVELSMLNIAALIILIPVISAFVGRMLATPFSRVFKLTDIEFMNEYYFRSWIKLVVGCTLFGIMLMLKNPNNWIDLSSGFLYGCIIYAACFGFIDWRKYNLLCRCFHILNIDNNEKFKEFIATHGDTNKKKEI